MASSNDMRPADARQTSGVERSAGAVHLTFYLSRALLAGVLAGVPGGWLLAYLAPIPYFLGVFFFLLVGLMVGALMCRMARPAAPIPRERMRPISLLVALVMWTTVLVMEYRWFPELAARHAVRMSLTSGMTQDAIEAYRRSVRQGVREKIDTAYRPGGFSGYLRWAATSGRMDLPRAGSDQPVSFQNVQRPLGWLVRVAASLLLLVFAIDSQMASLAPKPGQNRDEAEPGDGEQAPD